MRKALLGIGLLAIILFSIGCPSPTATPQNTDRTYIGQIISVTECGDYSLVKFRECTIPPPSGIRIIFQSPYGFDNSPYYYCVIDTTHTPEGDSNFIEWFREYNITTSSFNDFVTADAFNFMWTYTLRPFTKGDVQDEVQQIYEIVAVVDGVYVELINPQP